MSEYQPELQVHSVECTFVNENDQRTVLEIHTIGDDKLHVRIDRNSVKLMDPEIDASSILFSISAIEAHNLYVLLGEIIEGLSEAVQ